MWLQLRVEELPGGPGTYRVITFARIFSEQMRIAADIWRQRDD